MSKFAWWYDSLSFTCSYYFRWPLPYSKVTTLPKSFIWKFCVLICLNWNFVGCKTRTSIRSLIIYHNFLFYFFTFALIEGRWLTCFTTWQTFRSTFFFADTAQGRAFKLCIFVTLRWFYQFTPGLLTLTLFQVTVCRNH